MVYTTTRSVQRALGHYLALATRKISELDSLCRIFPMLAIDLARSILHSQQVRSITMRPRIFALEPTVTMVRLLSFLICALAYACQAP